MTIIADELPCEVLTPAGTLHRRVRAVITDEGVSAYAEGEPGAGPVLVYRARLTATPTDLPHPMAVRRRRVYRLETPEGQVVVNAVAGCMCNYPQLRHYTPVMLSNGVRAGLIPVTAV